jgi:hypothetical protein
VLNNHPNYTETTASHNATGVPHSASQEIGPADLRRQSWSYIAEGDDTLPRKGIKKDNFDFKGFRRQPLEFLEVLSQEQRTK